MDNTTQDVHEDDICGKEERPFFASYREALVVVKRKQKDNNLAVQHVLHAGLACLQAQGLCSWSAMQYEISSCEFLFRALLVFALCRSFFCGSKPDTTGTNKKQ
eukprot:1754086-Amphidinium_carterae.3